MPRDPRPHGGELVGALARAREPRSADRRPPASRRARHDRADHGSDGRAEVESRPPRRATRRLRARHSASASARSRSRTPRPPRTARRRPAGHAAFERFEEPARAGGQGGERAIGRALRSARGRCDRRTGRRSGPCRRARTGRSAWPRPSRSCIGGSGRPPRALPSRGVPAPRCRRDRGRRRPSPGFTARTIFSRGHASARIELHVGAAAPGLAAPVVRGLVSADQPRLDDERLELAAAADALDRRDLGRAGSRPSCARRRRSRTARGRGGPWTCPRTAPGPSRASEQVHAGRVREAVGEADLAEVRAPPRPARPRARSPSVQDAEPPTEVQQPVQHLGARPRRRRALDGSGCGPRAEVLGERLRAARSGTSGHTTRRASRAVQTAGPASGG